MINYVYTIKLRDVCYYSFCTCWFKHFDLIYTKHQENWFLLTHSRNY